jgi:SAM-dependent methyltransferase
MAPPRDHERDVSQDRHRRLSFGSVAEQYDRLRPGYPAAVIDAILHYADARPGDAILDVGAGTGRATLLFAERGYAVTAIEPDGAMAAVASQRAATAGLRLELLNTDFEQAELAPASFRAVISGTAWHWVSPELRNGLAARVLVPGGALAPFWNRPQWDGNPLRDALDGVYSAVEEEFGAGPDGPMNPLGQPREIRSARDWLDGEFEGNTDFTDIDARAFHWTERYSTEEYLGLLGTHSDHLTLPVAPRERLLAGIGAVIDAAGGSFELTYETLLCLGRRRAT